MALRSIRLSRFLVIIPFLLIMSTAGSVITGSQLVIRGRGSFKTIGIRAYWDPALTENVTEIDWGVIENGSYVAVSFYLKSASTVPVLLNITTMNYVPPEAEDSLTLTWDYDDSLLNPREIRLVTLTLWTHTRTEDLVDFAFDIIIYVTG